MEWSYNVDTSSPVHQSTLKKKFKKKINNKKKELDFCPLLIDSFINRLIDFDNLY